MLSTLGAEQAAIHLFSRENSIPRPALRKASGKGRGAADSAQPCGIPFLWDSARGGRPGEGLFQDPTSFSGAKSLGSSPSPRGAQVRQRESFCFREQGRSKLRTLFLLFYFFVQKLKFIELIQTNYLSGLNSTARSASKPKANCGRGKRSPQERTQNKTCDRLTAFPFASKLHTDA